MEKGTFEVKVGLAEMLKGGVIMDVTTPEQAKIAENAPNMQEMHQKCARMHQQMNQECTKKANSD